MHDASLDCVQVPKVSLPSCEHCNCSVRLLYPGGVNLIGLVRREPFERDNRWDEGLSTTDRTRTAEPPTPICKHKRALSREQAVHRLQNQIGHKDVTMSVPQPTDIEPLCAYERERAARILRNRQVMGGKDPCLQRYLPQPDACKIGTSAGWLGEFFCMRRGHGSGTASDAVPGRLQGGQGTPPTEEGKGGLATLLHQLCRAVDACMHVPACSSNSCLPCITVSWG